MVKKKSSKSQSKPASESVRATLNKLTSTLLEKALKRNREELMEMFRPIMHLVSSMQNSSEWVPPLRVSLETCEGTTATAEIGKVVEAMIEALDVYMKPAIENRVLHDLIDRIEPRRKGRRTKHAVR